jgi:phosphatidate cytidylyltransferase
LSPTRHGDHRSLVLAFFVVLPVQYWLVGSRHFFDLFTVFIPVYVFLAIPVASALANDPQRFLERNAKLQWGIMVCIYGMSHVPALLLLDFPNYHKNAFLVLLSGAGGAELHGCPAPGAPLAAPPPVAPNISHSFTWRSWWVGMAVGSLLGRIAWRASRRLYLGRRLQWPSLPVWRVAGPFGDEGAQARPRHPDLAR